MSPTHKPQDDPDVVIVKVNRISSDRLSSTDSTPSKPDQSSFHSSPTTPLATNFNKSSAFTPDDPFGPFLQPISPTPEANIPPRRPAGPLQDNSTASHGDQDKWSLSNLPNIIYALRPGKKYARLRNVVRMRDDTIFGKRLRDFDVLPDRISSEVEGWRLEAWMRLDRRIMEQDIIDRVNPRFRYRISPEFIQYRREYFRQEFHIACWGSQRSTGIITGKLKEKKIDISLNTTRGLTPGLIDPSKGEAGGRVPLPPKEICRILSGQGLQPIPKRVAKDKSSHISQECLIPISDLYTRQKVSRSALMESISLDDDGALPSNTNTSDVQYLGSFPIAYSGRKRQRYFRPFGQEHLSADLKKRRLATQCSLSTLDAYPFILRELASCSGPPARAFSPEDDTGGRAMPLEEYLSANDLTFDDFLHTRYVE